MTENAHHFWDCRCVECRDKAIDLTATMIDDALESLSLHWEDPQAVILALSKSHRVPAYVIRPVEVHKVDYTPQVEDSIRGILKCEIWESIQEEWRECRNDAKHIAAVEACIRVVETSGLISPEDATLWRAAIKSCPGHDDEGGRTWCAYGCYRGDK